LFPELINESFINWFLFATALDQKQTDIAAHQV